MLTIKDIRKEYVTGDLTQTALDGVSLNFRDNEFVAVLGPSGSGKTTLLNVIGGLDRYDSGELIINGISTKKYKDRDWDSYRNHTIGFVFQSYNLIPHQTILSNVELALTISGVSKSERKRRAREALEKVGLGDQLHKRPNQMSGGQMQRVAIARALVNDPEILLADEPTGALDSETSLQVMDLLNEVANDRLVIMVTHNPELADKYATRIVKLSDGKIIGDTNPFEIKEDEQKEPEHKNMGKASMSFLTSLSLSFNNLRTKKARTILTSFAGSIGIIGIALIQSLSTGVNVYIDSIQRDTMASYPITIDAQTVDLNSIINSSSSMSRSTGKADHELDAVYTNDRKLQSAADMMSSFTENNLTKFKKYLDNKDSEIHKYIGGNGIVYSYNTKFGVYTYDDDNTLINTDGSSLNVENSSMQFGSITMTSSYGGSSGLTSMFDDSLIYTQIIPSPDGKGISTSVTDNYDVVYGKLPDEFNEMVLVLDSNNEVPSTVLYQLGLLPLEEYKDIVTKITSSEGVDIKARKLTYKDVCTKDFYLLPASDLFEKSADGTYTDISDDSAKIEGKLKDAVKMRISGIIRPKEENRSRLIKTPVGYTKALTDYLMKYADESEIVKAQRDDPDTNILNGLSFNAETDEEKAENVIKYFSSLGISDKARIMTSLWTTISEKDPELIQKITAAFAQQQQAAMQQTSQQLTPEQLAQFQASQQLTPEQLAQLQASQQQASQQQTAASTQVPDGISPDDLKELDIRTLGEEKLAAMFDMFLQTPDQKILVGLYDKYISKVTFDEILSMMGVVNVNTPSSIDIYADSFESKDEIARCILDYNKTVDEADQITYTDFVGLLMSSVTTIINVISYVLIAFVAVSLIVSSIMIGIITYISVLERTKEIGILRAIGASKRNISRVFNAETFIIGLISGAMGIGISFLLLWPINAIIHAIAQNNNVNAILPFTNCVILVVLSVLLTLIGGIIPSRKAAKKDPVTALRTD